MRLGITGNTTKDSLWDPLSGLLSFLEDSDCDYILHPAVFEGLRERNMLSASGARANSVSDFHQESDIIVSMGGDGTLLNTVARLGEHQKPVLGVNYGRLGFLASVEGSDIRDYIENLKKGDFSLDERLVLHASLASGQKLSHPWAMNEFTIQRSGDASLLSIEVEVDGAHLNTYWADGLVISTPTGSTAYSMALGGPIMTPQCGSILITPIAPHTLTVRPVVISEDSTIRVKILDSDKSHIFTADGVNKKDVLTSDSVTVQKAGHVVNLVRFPGQDYFSTLRSKLMWGASKTFQ